MSTFSIDPIKAVVLIVVLLVSNESVLGQRPMDGSGVIQTETGEILANNVIYLTGWPPVITVHFVFGLLLWGAIRRLKTLA